MRVALGTIALAAALLATSAASAQISQSTTSPKTNGPVLPSYASSRISLAQSFSNALDIRNLLPSFRSGSNVSGLMTSVPDPANSATYLSGFGYKRLGR